MWIDLDFDPSPKLVQLQTTNESLLGQLKRILQKKHQTFALIVQRHALINFIIKPFEGKTNIKA